jgi:hypothetical protein
VGREGYTGSSLSTALPIATVQSGQTETLTIPDGRSVRYDVTRPSLPSGQPQGLPEGIRSWCSSEW